MELQLAGQTAVIFGGARGIGHAIGAAFVRERCRVILCDRDESVRVAATDLGPDCQGVAGDVLRLADVESIARTATAGPSPMVHVVYSVGVGSGKFGFPFWNLTPADWPRVLEVNLIGAVNVAHAFAPHFVAVQAGTLLLLTSVAGQIGSQTDPPYSAAKAALINFMQCAAKDLAPHNVRVNCLSPGMVRTELNQSVWAAGQQARPESEREDYETWAGKKIRQISPLGRWQTPEEFGALATYLASPHARSITGQTLNVDGGQVMHA